MPQSQPPGFRQTRSPRWPLWTSNGWPVRQPGLRPGSESTWASCSCRRNVVDESANPMMRRLPWQGSADIPFGVRTKLTSAMSRCWQLAFHAGCQRSGTHGPGGPPTGEMDRRMNEAAAGIARFAWPALGKSPIIPAIAPTRYGRELSTFPSSDPVDLSTRSWVRVPTASNPRPSTTRSIPTTEFRLRLTVCVICRVHHSATSGDSDDYAKGARRRPISAQRKVRLIGTGAPEAQAPREIQEAEFTLANWFDHSLRICSVSRAVMGVAPGSQPNSIGLAMRFIIW